MNAAKDVSDDFDFLSIDRGSVTPSRANGGLNSSYYVHASKVGEKVYLDYWWYFAQNPLPVGKRILCGPGLRAKEITCFEHPADWEGITVVLAPCETTDGTRSSCQSSAAGDLRIIAVHYAEHRNVKSFG